MTTRSLAVLGSVVALLAASACSAQDPDQAGRQSAAPQPQGQVPTQQRNDALRAKLPADIQSAGKLTTVNSGSFPPYEIIQTDGSATGASADLVKALGEMWGIQIDHQTVDGLSSILTGLSADRYQMAFGPIGDFADRQKSNDFVDYVQEFVVFAVASGNPKKITDLDTTCGLKIAVQAGGSAEKVIKKQSETCTSSGRPAVEVMSFKDQPQSILAVQSGRADAFFSSQAPLTYFVKESGGKLELAGTGKPNGFDTLYQGAVVKKDSPIGPVLQESLEELFRNGTYDAVMKKWGIEGNKIDKPGKNLAKS